MAKEDLDNDYKYYEVMVIVILVSVTVALETHRVNDDAYVALVSGILGYVFGRERKETR